MYTTHAAQATIPYTVQRTHTRTHGEWYNVRAAQADRHTHTYTHTDTLLALPKPNTVPHVQLVTLAEHLERSAQIPLQVLIAIGHEVQITLDQCERPTSKSPQLEGEREVVVDLVIGYDLAMA